MNRLMGRRSLRQKIMHDCTFLTKKKLCSVYLGQDSPFDYSNHSKCTRPKKGHNDCKKYDEAVDKIPNLLAGRPINIKFY